MYKLDSEKAEEPEIKLPASNGSSKKVKEVEKNIYFCFIDYAKPLTVWITKTVENFEKDGNTRPPDLPIEKSVCQEAIVRTGHGTTDWFQIGKGVHQGCLLLPCLFKLYAEYIM